MSDKAITLSEPSPLEAAPNPRREKQLRWFELILILAISFGTYLFSSLGILIYQHPERAGMNQFRWTTGCVHELACLALLGYILSRRKLRVRDLGLCWSLRDIVVGLGLFALSYMVYSIASYGVHALLKVFLPSALSTVQASQLFAHFTFMTISFTLINPFFEELIVRAYLITEIKDLTGSSTLAVLVSTLLQAAYHLYYGWQVAISFAFVFLVFSLYYSHTRKATPLVTAHAIQDILAMIQLI